MLKWGFMPRYCFNRPNRKNKRYFSACDAARIAREVVKDRGLTPEEVLACVAKGLGFTHIIVNKKNVSPFPDIKVKPSSGADPMQDVIDFIVGERLPITSQQVLDAIFNTPNITTAQQLQIIFSAITLKKGPSLPSFSQLTAGIGGFLFAVSQLITALSNIRDGSVIKPVGDAIRIGTCDCKDAPKTNIQQL